MSRQQSVPFLQWSAEKPKTKYLSVANPLQISRRSNQYARQYLWSRTNYSRFEIQLWKAISCIKHALVHIETRVWIFRNKASADFLIEIKSSLESNYPWTWIFRSGPVHFNWEEWVNPISLLSKRQAFQLNQ